MTDLMPTDQMKTGSADEITQRFTQVCNQILSGSRTELYMSMRYLDIALSSLRFAISTELPGIGTDGEHIIAHPKLLADMFEKDRRLINRVYLHIVVHCLMRHLFKKPRGNELLWRISCDIATEAIIDSMRYRCIRMGVSRFRMNMYEDLRRELKVLTAEGIYKTLDRRLRTNQLSPYEITRMKEEFCIDDHTLWPKMDDQNGPPPPETEMMRNRWDDISEKTQTEMETFAKEQAEGAGDMLNDLQVENRERYDYKGFLRKFAVMREEMQVDPDSFDYVFYTYGLSVYGNMPLIEPQEFSEVHKIEEFVIVIDVSMSTSGELVRTFLQQTYSVLTESESYLKKVHIRIIQCDEEVRSDVKITSREELDRYMENFELMGGGGTDFRPAFEYVKFLVDVGEFHGLKGMIYFTDGYGIYPSRRPPWETAFVFMEEDYTDVDVPPWAIKLIIEKEDLEEEKERFRSDASFIWDDELTRVSTGE